MKYLFKMVLENCKHDFHGRNLGSFRTLETIVLLITVH